MESQASVRQRGSISSHIAPARNPTNGSTTRLRSDSNGTMGSAEQGMEQQAEHPVEPRARTAMLPPVMVFSPRLRDTGAVIADQVMIRRRSRSTTTHFAGSDSRKIASSHRAKTVSADWRKEAALSVFMLIYAALASGGQHRHLQSCAQEPVLAADPTTKDMHLLTTGNRSH